MPSEINKEWQEWIITSFKNGIEIDEIASIMIDAGIDKEIASDEVTKLKIQEIAEVLELKRMCLVMSQLLTIVKVAVNLTKSMVK
jgi:hypothetical protein